MKLIVFLSFFIVAITANAQTREELVNELGNLYNTGEFEKAIPVAKKVIELTKKELGENHLQYARSLNDLAALYFALEDFKEAQPLALKAAAIRKKISGENNPLYAETLLGVAMTYSGMGEYEKSLTHYLQLAVIWKKIEGEYSAEHANALKNIALVYADMSDYERAVQYHLLSGTIWKKIAGERSAEYATSVYNLGYLHYIFGNYEKAEQSAKQSGEITKSLVGSGDPEYATSLSLTGLSCLALGRFDDAEPVLLEAAEIERKSGNENNYATARGNLAMLYQGIGHYKKAEPILQEVIAIKKRLVGTEHHEYALAVNNLSVLYVETKEYEKAEPLLNEVIEIRRKLLGESDPNFALALHNLASLYLVQERYKEAESSLLRATEIRRKTLGETHPEYAASLANLATLYYDLKRYPESEQALIKAQNILKNNPGKDHPDYAANLNSVATLYAATGRLEKAETFMMSSNLITKENIRRTFVFLSEREKEQFLENRITVLDDNNSLLYNNKKAGTRFIRHCYSQLLFFKSLLLSDSRNLVKMVQLSDDLSIKIRFDKWKMLRKQLAEEYSLPPNERAKDLGKKEGEAEMLEKQLMQQSAPFRQQQTDLNKGIDDIRNALMPDEAAIEFVRFDLFNRQWTDSTMYAAYILRKKDSIPVFVPLCEEGQLQKLFDSAGINATSMVSKFYRGLEGKSKNAAGESGVELYKLAWEPLEPYLKNIKKISYAPAGKLYSVAFHALTVDSSTLLMDKYELRQFTSTRDIAMNKQETSGEKMTSVVLFGDPVFTMDSLQLAQQKKPGKDIALSLQLTASVTRAYNDSLWSELPGTAVEVNKVKQLFDDNGISSRMYTRAGASEEQLKALSGNSPQLLHIATHGFFLPDPADQKKEDGLAAENTYTIAKDPLLRSGLVLSGGNYAWSGKAPLAGVEDGIVTSYEISQLDLTRTELVVLSACETALGEIRGSEGVFGLQRAFKMAGVKKMIVSLWQVPDKETVELMNNFYDQRIKGKSIEEAFSLAQAGMRKKYAAFYWAAFVLVQ